jgi:hypothetical protein
MMFTVAWVDTPAGRRWAALRSAKMLVIGVVAYTIGRFVLVWKGLVMWAGDGLILFGALGVVWAYLHPSHDGLLLPLSAACASNRHAECALSTTTTERCFCQCHMREVNIRTHPSESDAVTKRLHANDGAGPTAG